MPRSSNGLTALKVKQAKKPGLYNDGGGLYLRIAPGGSKSWVYRYQRAGERRYKGLGGLDAVSLADARRKAAEARRMLSEGNDPIDVARAAERARTHSRAKITTFAEAARSYVEAHESGWRNEKHGKQWLATLEAYAFPVFGDEPVGAIDTPMIVKVLQPIWSKKTETARRVRGRVENILDWARAGGLRSGENPARWRGLLEHMLPKKPTAAAVQHHPALPYPQVGEFVAALRLQNGTASRALEFTILTAARTSEVTGARWNEIDLDTALWTVPASRIKAQREHRVPLSEPAFAILRAQAETSQGEFVFPGGRKNLPLSNMAMATVLKRMKRDAVTVHGFRSAFRDWAAERTNYPREVAEMALAHAVGDKVEAAYRRGDLLEKRKQIMADWAKYCDRIEQPARVIQLARIKA
jgi:integrase